MNFLVFSLSTSGFKALSGVEGVPYFCWFLSFFLRSSYQNYRSIYYFYWVLSKLRSTSFYFSSVKFWVSIFELIISRVAYSESGVYVTSLPVARDSNSNSVPWNPIVRFLVSAFSNSFFYFRFSSSIPAFLRLNSADIASVSVWYY